MLVIDYAYDLGLGYGMEFWRSSIGHKSMVGGVIG